MKIPQPKPEKWDIDFSSKTISKKECLACYYYEYARQYALEQPEYLKNLKNQLTCFLQPFEKWLQLSLYFPKAWLTCDSFARLYMARSCPRTPAELDCFELEKVLKAKKIISQLFSNTATVLEKIFSGVNDVIEKLNHPDYTPIVVFLNKGLSVEETRAQFNKWSGLSENSQFFKPKESNVATPIEKLKWLSAYRLLRWNKNYMTTQNRSLELLGKPLYQATKKNDKFINCGRWKWAYDQAKAELEKLFPPSQVIPQEVTDKLYKMAENELSKKFLFTPDRLSKKYKEKNKI